MPSSKEARARQNRQKERVAAALAERRRTQKRRRRGGAVAAVILLVIVVAIGLAVGGGSSNSPKVAVSPSTVAGKQCVGLKQSLPKGAPAMPLTPGPAPTKLTTRDLKIGTGAVVPKNAKVTVNYVGVACSTGKIFDSSYTAKPFAADLAGGVIAGWTQGVPGMRVGGVRLLSIPSDLGYGAAGSAPAIGADEPLFFLVAVVKLG
jgi:peptidylprolyl isomerase